MRIAFLCSSLEPGRDGVGDYVRQFACELTRSGHQCLLIALADRYVPGEFHGSHPEYGFGIVRLTMEQWLRGEITTAEQALDRFSADWVSLQMVCYGFESQGLLFRSARLFGKLARPAQRHLMFHELWIGESIGYDFKQRTLGLLQKRLLLRACEAWQPRVIHTSNPLYRELLRRNAIRAELLPLPGNIPIGDATPSHARQRLLEWLDLEAKPDALLAGVFGSIHPEWRATTRLGELAAACSRKGRSMALLQLGRAGTMGEKFWEDLRLEFGTAVHFHRVGEASEEELSRVMHGLDLGLSTSPWCLSGKSGSVAAFLDHGVPVLATREDGGLRHGVTPEPTAHPLLHRFDPGFPQRLADGVIGKGVTGKPTAIYRAFLDSLEAAAAHASPLQGSPTSFPH